MSSDSLHSEASDLTTGDIIIEDSVLICNSTTESTSNSQNESSVNLLVNTELVSDKKSVALTDGGDVKTDCDSDQVGLDDTVYMEFPSYDTSYDKKRKKTELVLVLEEAEK